MRLAVVLLAGCYSASPALDVPCSLDLSCPRGQACDLARSPPTCVPEREPADAALDAAVACSVSANSCPPTTPICDTNTMTCRRCVQDSDCTASNACSESRGTCIDEPAAIYVQNGGDDAQQCTKLLPCANLARAVTLVSPARNFIRLGSGDYSEQLAITTSVTISGPSTSQPPHLTSPQLGATLVASGTGTELTLETLQIVSSQTGVAGNAGTKVVLFGVTIDSCNNQAFTLQSAIGEVRQSTIVNNQRGIEAQNNSSILVNRTLLKATHDVPLRANSSKYEITSSLFVDNQRGTSIEGTLVSGSKFEHNTVIGTQERGVKCSAAGAVIGSSIFVGNNRPQVDTPRCVVRYSLVDDELVQGAGNLTGDPSFVGGGNYHLTAASKAIDAADPLSVEAFDFDGQARPRGPRADMGAFEH